MDFAKKQLEKYGWKEGQGLGKNETGIVQPLKPQLKFDNGGLGHELGADFTNNWWENLYNKASDNLAVNKDDNGDTVVSTISGESVEITTKDYSLAKLKKKHKSKMEYGSFLKTSKLTEEGMVSYGVVVPETSAVKVPTLTDEELFNACGGRTAHKGARHGLKLSGKLARIERQEMLLMKQLRRVSLTDDDDTVTCSRKSMTCSREKKTIKLQAEKVKVIKQEQEVKVPKKKKHKKKCKSVSFNNTISELIPDSDVDTSLSNSEDTLALNNERNLYNNNNNGDDEGIELDSENNALSPQSTVTTSGGDHRSFEELQPKSIKKVRKRKNGNERATERFLREMNNRDSDESSDRNDRDLDGSSDVRDVERNSRSKAVKLKRKQVEPLVVKQPKKFRDSMEINEFSYKNRSSKSGEIKSITKSLDKVCKISEENK